MRTATTGELRDRARELRREINRLYMDAGVAESELQDVEVEIDERVDALVKERAEDEEEP